MSGWDGAGVFNRLYSWVADAAANIDISSSRMDQDTDLIASNGFGNCLTRDGQGFATANLPMGGFKHTNVANGVATNDYAAFGQIQSGSTQWAVAGGTSAAITATYTPSLTSLIDGQVVSFRATAANLTTVPTFSPNGLTAHAITKNGGQALAIGDIPGNLAEIELRYNLANTRWEMTNPPQVPVGAMVPFFGASVPSGYALPQGQNLSATTFPAANAVLGTTYGSPGGGNFTMPDLRGRVPAGIDNGAGRLTVGGGAGFDGTVLGAAGGAQSTAFAIAQVNLPNYVLASYTPGTVALNALGTSPADLALWNGAAVSVTAGGAIGVPIQGGGDMALLAATSLSVNIPSLSVLLGGSGAAIDPSATQPTMVTNWMMRIA